MSALITALCLTNVTLVTQCHTLLSEISYSLIEDVGGRPISGDRGSCEWGNKVQSIFLIQ